MLSENCNVMTSRLDDGEDTIVNAAFFAWLIVVR
jgi:hypothetical protein